MDPAGLFVTGTGTEVGKTVVAAVIAAEAAASGLDCAVFKPAVSGLDEGGEPDHALLARASGSAQTEDEIAPYRYGPPLSPHLAAELAGEEIDTDRVERAAEAAADGADVIVCEGVGGLMVPLTPRLPGPQPRRRPRSSARHRRGAGARDDQPHAADDRSGLDGRARGPRRRAHSLARRGRPPRAVEPRDDRGADRGRGDDARPDRSRGAGGLAAPRPALDDPAQPPICALPDPCLPTGCRRSFARDERTDHGARPPASVASVHPAARLGGGAAARHRARRGHRPDRDRRDPLHRRHVVALVQHPRPSPSDDRRRDPRPARPRRAFDDARPHARPGGRAGRAPVRRSRRPG